MEIFSFRDELLLHPVNGKVRINIFPLGGARYTCTCISDTGRGSILSPSQRCQHCWQISAWWIIKLIGSLDRVGVENCENAATKGRTRCHGGDWALLGWNAQCPRRLSVVVENASRRPYPSKPSSPSSCHHFADFAAGSDIVLSQQYYFQLLLLRDMTRAGADAHPTKVLLCCFCLDHIQLSLDHRKLTASVD